MDKCQMTPRYLSTLVLIPLSSLDPSLSSPHLAEIEQPDRQQGQQEKETSLAELDFRGSSLAQQYESQN